MKIYFTIETSVEVIDKITLISKYSEKIDDFFKGRLYSNDLEYLYIALYCMNPKFDPFFPPRKSKYTAETKRYIHKGVELEKRAKTFEYDLRLDFKVYSELEDVKQRLANDIINSLDNLLLTKKIKNLDLIQFKEDFQQIFKEIKWL